jgi:diguanylate cyclase (GGDEF)-like protein/PAS domain S-box-containing protein
MTIKKFQSLMKHLPAGYAQYEAVINKTTGEITDYIFLDANEEFENIIRIKRNKIIGRRISDIIPKEMFKKFEWSLHFGNDVQSGLVEEITQYMYIYDKYCKIKAFKYGNMHFATMLIAENIKNNTLQNNKAMKHLLDLFYEHSAVMLLVRSDTGEIINANQAACEFYGYTKEQFSALSLQSICCDAVNETQKENNEKKAPGKLFIHQLSNGEKRVVNVHSSPVGFLEHDCNLMIIFDITSADKYIKQRHREGKQTEEMFYSKHYDELTGLYNRYYISEKIKNFDFKSVLPVAIVMCDINGLKVFNDVFGREKGDELLKKVSHILKETCRNDDVIARWGEDEFLILLPQTSKINAYKVIQRINKALEAKRSEIMQLSMSFGFAIKCDENEDIQQKLKEAEKWMHHKKLLDGKSYRSTIINTLLSILYEKSAETEEHSRRLAKHCFKMGRLLKFPSEEMSELLLLAILHDIGKIGIDQQILIKPDKLTAQEWEKMKQHCEIGYRIIKNIPELSTVAEYVLLHHERWDGKGYPKGYKDTQIPLPCRLLAIADAYDVMTNGRVYKEAMSHEAAIEELKCNSASQFDPDCVEIFLQTISDLSEYEFDNDFVLHMQ